MAVSMWFEDDRKRREVAHLDYVGSLGFSAIADIARSKGYRKATIAEINASAERHQNAADLFCWRGGLWVKLEN